MEDHPTRQRAAYLDFAEGIVGTLLKKLPAGTADRHDVTQRAATVLVADYLQGMLGAQFMSPLRTFSTLDEDTCGNLAGMIHQVFVEASYWPKPSVDDRLREDELTNSLQTLRHALRDANIER